MRRRTGMKKILVGDDEIRIRLLYEEVLAEAGYKVIAAKDGKEVCEKFRIEKPDLVILDVKMPGMHGIEALERIREMDRNVPVIMSTAYQKMQSDAVISTSDVAAFITKPIDINNLRSEVSRILEEREKSQGAAETQKQRVAD
jgi:two-component system response regulator (stage 0 sporulation protein F)